MTSFADRQAIRDGQDAPPSAIGDGVLRSQLSTALGKLYREMFGRGPVKTATYAFDAGYVTFLRDVLAPHERVLVLGGRADLVRETRMAVREAEREQVVGEVQRLTGCPVLRDSFQFQPERDLAIELFWMPAGLEDWGPRPHAPQGLSDGNA